MNCHAVCKPNCRFLRGERIPRLPNRLHCLKELCAMVVTAGNKAFSYHYVYCLWISNRIERELSLREPGIQPLPLLFGRSTVICRLTIGSTDRSIDIRLIFELISAYFKEANTLCGVQQILAGTETDVVVIIWVYGLPLPYIYSAFSAKRGLQAV